MTVINSEYGRARREGLPTWHIIESTIAGAAITNCGRRMEPTNQRGKGLVWATAEEADLVEHAACLLCASVS